MLRSLIVIVILTLGLQTATAAESVGGTRAFSFIALGDTSYKPPEDDDKFNRLIAAINGFRPAFSIHVGDIKNGRSACTDELYKNVYDQFQTFEQPLVYALGDNEWVDCHRNKSGPNDPRERLSKLREIFFSLPDRSLGKTSMQVISQASLMPDYSKYVENIFFIKNDVLFAVLNIPGSNNGLDPLDSASVTEFLARNKANIAWIDAAFAKAIETGAKGVVLAFQANPYDIRDTQNTIPPASGFSDTIDAIERGANSFGKPVLVINGDYHTFQIDGFRNTKMELVPNALRLQVMGETRTHAVRVIVDPDMPGVFGFIPFIVPENGPF